MILDMIARLPGLTEVDGSMIPLEEHDDTTRTRKGWHRAGWLYLVVNVFYDDRRFIFIPWP